MTGKYSARGIPKFREDGETAECYSKGEMLAIKRWHRVGILAGWNGRFSLSSGCSVPSPLTRPILTEGVAAFLPDARRFLGLRSRNNGHAHRLSTGTNVITKHSLMPSR